MATSTAAPNAGAPAWLIALVPLVLIAILVGIFIVTEPIGSLNTVPPAETVSVERTVLTENEIALTVRNDSPDPVTLAQVLVNDAYRPFEVGDADLGRLESTRITIPYAWEEGLPLNIALLSRNGVKTEHEIEAATLTPESGAREFGIYALLGVYIGVIPVLAGLLWFPALRRASPKWTAFVLAITIGLLVFLLIDTVAEGVELSSQGGAFDGLALFGIGAVLSVLALMATGRAIGERRAAGLGLAYLIAIGIGLHNLGEGLAVGAAVAAGEVALGTFLVIGFAIHNTTEGLAIVAPLSDARPALKHFLWLGAVAGLPTILGAWVGGFAFHPAAAALFFGIAAGAIAQVVWTVGRGLPGKYGLTSAIGAAGVAVGMAVMYLTGLIAV